MSAHVLLNSLNELRKIDKMLGLPSILSLFPNKIVLTSAKSVDPDEMQHNAAFHLDLHFLQLYSFRDFQNTKG